MKITVLLATVITLFGVHVSSYADTWEYCPAATNKGYVLNDNGCSDSVRKGLDKDFNFLEDFVGVGVTGPLLWFGVDKLDPLVDFAASCTGHDICYATPGEDKSVCDTEFRHHMKDSCSARYPKISQKYCKGFYFSWLGSKICKEATRWIPNPLKEHCDTVAQGYYLAVSKASVAKSEFKKLHQMGDDAANVCDAEGQGYSYFGVFPSGSPPPPKKQYVEKSCEEMCKGHSECMARSGYCD